MVVLKAGREYRMLQENYKVHIHARHLAIVSDIPCVFAAFGFCEYADPESTLRALRLLHDFRLGEKYLVVSLDWRLPRKNGILELCFFLLVTG